MWIEHCLLITSSCWGSLPSLSLTLPEFGLRYALEFKTNVHKSWFLQGTLPHGLYKAGLGLESLLGDGIQFGRLYSPSGRLRSLWSFMRAGEGLLSRVLTEVFKNDCSVYWHTVFLKNLEWSGSCNLPSCAVCSLPWFSGETPFSSLTIAIIWWQIDALHLGSENFKWLEKMALKYL